MLALHIKYKLGTLAVVVGYFPGAKSQQHINKRRLLRLLLQVALQTNLSLCGHRFESDFVSLSISYIAQNVYGYSFAQRTQQNQY